MFFEEHIERIKKKFPVSDFRIPFLDASDVLGKIEKKFIGGKSVETSIAIVWRSPNWMEGIDDKTELARIGTTQIEQFLSCLNPGINYWIVIAQGVNRFVKYFVYDARLIPMIEIINIASGDFFIVEKKYKWLIGFSNDNGNLTVYKSGSQLTPFG